MSLPPVIRARIVAQILAKEALLIKAELAYESALGNSETQSYMIDTGEGKQAATRRKPAEIREEISALETSLNSLYTRLSGTGLCNMTLRRYR